MQLSDEWLAAHGKHPYQSDPENGIWYWTKQDSDDTEFNLPDDLYDLLEGRQGYPTVRMYHSEEEALADFRQAYMRWTAQRLIGAADSYLEVAKGLVGEGATKKSARELLSGLTDTTLIDHDGETCGQCCHQRIMAAVAQELVVQEDIPDDELLERWTDEAGRRWRASKFFRLYDEECRAGRNPQDAFDARGWEM